MFIGAQTHPGGTHPQCGPPNDGIRDNAKHADHTASAWVLSVIGVTRGGRLRRESQMKGPDARETREACSAPGAVFLVR